MNEDQADQIIALLEEIRDNLSSINSNTFDISSIESNTDDTVRCLKNIQNNLR